MKMWLLSILLPGLILTANACGPAEEPGKTVVPFCTSHSSGIGSSNTDLHALASQAVWKPGKRFGGNETREAVRAWIESLGLNPDESNVGRFNLSAGENGKAPTVRLSSGYDIPYPKNQLTCGCPKEYRKDNYFGKK